MITKQKDVRGAFTYGDCDVPIYMAQPTGYTDSTFPDYVCKLNRSLYGLRQASHIWHKTIDSYLKTLNLTAMDSDPCIYYRHQGPDLLIVCLYVDNIVIASNNSSLIVEINNALCTRFEMTDEDDDFMLNIHIVRDLTNRSVTLSQEHVITELCSSVDLSDIPFTATPILTTTATSADCPVLNSDEWLAMQKNPYSSIVGSLVSISRQTRPDISYAVSVVGRFVKNPGLAHWNILRRILKYLSATATFGLTLGLSPHSSFKTRHLDLTLEPSQHDLVGYVDADWGGCTDTAKSTTGFGFYLYGCLVTWRSKLQNTVSCSST